MTIRVNAYSGYMGEETPRSFFLDERELTVTKVVKTWKDQHLNRHFVVLADDGARYTLVCLHATSEWELLPGNAG